MGGLTFAMESVTKAKGPKKSLRDIPLDVEKRLEGKERMGTKAHIL